PERRARRWMAAPLINVTLPWPVSSVPERFMTVHQLLCILAEVCEPKVPGMLSEVFASYHATLWRGLEASFAARSESDEREMAERSLWFVRLSVVWHSQLLDPILPLLAAGKDRDAALYDSVGDDAITKLAGVYIHAGQYAQAVSFLERHIHGDPIRALRGALH